MTAIEYYISRIRPHIKSLFPDNVVVRDSTLPPLFGLKTLVSKTSIINGFAFLKSSEQTLATFNRTFLEILNEFNDFGPLTTIDPEFKLRLYETFLKRSARQQKLGQYFTPRNIVKPMIRMARLDRLPDDAIVFDPAAGVGGFVLEPLILPGALPNSVHFERDRAIRACEDPRGRRRRHNAHPGEGQQPDPPSGGGARPERHHRGAQPVHGRDVRGNEQ